MQEVERQHYAKLQPDSALFLSMDRDDWATLLSLIHI